MHLDEYNLGYVLPTLSSFGTWAPYEAEFLQAILKDLLCWALIQKIFVGTGILCKYITKANG